MAIVFNVIYPLNFFLRSLSSVGSCCNECTTIPSNGVWNPFCSTWWKAPTWTQWIP